MAVDLYLDSLCVPEPLGVNPVIDAEELILSPATIVTIASINPKQFRLLGRRLDLVYPLLAERRGNSLANDTFILLDQGQAEAGL